MSHLLAVVLARCSAYRSWSILPSSFCFKKNKAIVYSIINLILATQQNLPNYSPKSRGKTHVTPTIPAIDALTIRGNKLLN